MSVFLDVIGYSGAVIFVVALFLIWRYHATVGAARRLEGEFLEEIEPIWRRLYAGEDPELSDVERFAKVPRTRWTLFDLLLFHKRKELIPPPYRTEGALAESQLVVWLMHPNELGAQPDEIELAAEVELSGGRARKWLVFRFRVNPPHWAAKNGWMAGVVGPFAGRSSDEALPGKVAWSMFEPFESMSPENHASACRDLAVRTGMVK